MLFVIPGSDSDTEYHYHGLHLATRHRSSSRDPGANPCVRGIRVRWLSAEVWLAWNYLFLTLFRRWNNTYIFDSSVSCPNLDTPVGCAGRWGGFFVESSSTSWAQAASFAALSTARETIGDHDQDLPGNDTVHLNSSLALTTFPLGISRVKDTYGSMNSIGLGSNSTLLNALVSAGTIASKTWAFFQGWTGAESNQQMDGSLVLGGYDKAKVMGNNITLPFSESLNCISHLIVTITDIKMNLKNGSNPSILGPSAGSAFKACIKPDVHVTGLSSDIWSSFVGISGVHEIGRSDGINFWGMLISAKGA